jgi:hypothetical protein
MVETTFLVGLFFFLLLRKTKSQKAQRVRRVRGVDAELKAIIESDNDATGIAFEIKAFLLSVIEDDKNDLEKFSDARIAQAGRILDRAGPSAMYWMTDIAAQLAFLGAAQVNGITTNVNLELGESATPEQIVNVVVKG